MVSASSTGGGKDGGGDIFKDEEVFEDIKGVRLNGLWKVRCYIVGVRE